MSSPVESSSTHAADLLDGLGAAGRDASDGMASLALARGDLRAAFERLHQAGFKQNTLVTAVDRHPSTPRFEVIWQFLRHAPYERVRLACELELEDARVPTCCDLWPGAQFSERECFDMFGIEFEGHPDLRRLLMPAGYDHFPLRKDFPHQGIEPDRLYRAWDRERRAVWEANRETRG